MYGIRYLKTINHIPVSQCTTRLTRESKVDPRQPRRKGNKNLRTNYSYTTTVVFYL